MCLYVSIDRSTAETDCTRYTNIFCDYEFIDLYIYDLFNKDASSSEYNDWVIIK
jgi:hypothetical protein